MVFPPRSSRPLRVWPVAFVWLIVGVGACDDAAGERTSRVVHVRADVVATGDGAVATADTATADTATAADTAIALDTSPADAVAPDATSDAAPPVDAHDPCDVPELCNGVDDDCDGLTDEGFAGLGEACDGDDDDLCADGTIVCAPGGLGTRCDDDAASAVEVCNGVDDDCDGLTDEGGVCPPAAPRVCYPGPANTWDVCFDLVPRASIGVSGYTYPSSSDPRYQPPVNLLDLQAAPATTKVAANFQLNELMQAWKGRYGVYSAAAVARWQAVRSQLGVPLHVNSGYRSPTYNAGVGGATFSRHMYGDAADVTAQGAVSLQAIINACVAQGADFTQLYTSHVHCDWRNDPLGHDFWPLGPAAGPVLPGSAPTPASELPAGLWADAEATGDGPWRVGEVIALEASWGEAFDEGEPWVSWRVVGGEADMGGAEPTPTFEVAATAPGTLRVWWAVGGVFEGEIDLEIVE